MDEVKPQNMPGLQDGTQVPQAPQALQDTQPSHNTQASHDTQGSSSHDTQPSHGAHAPQPEPVKSNSNKQNQGLFKSWGASAYSNILNIFGF